MSLRVASESLLSLVRFARPVSSESNSGKVFFLMSRVEHPRMWRRVLRLRRYCSESLVAGFERIGSPVMHDHDFLSLGKIAHQRFLERALVYIKAARKCLRPIARADVCYAFSLDLLLLLYVLKSVMRARCKLVYEVADIHPYLYARGFKGKLMRALERFLVKRSSVVVLTSQGFKDGYFRDLQKLTGFQSVVIEHKVELPEKERRAISCERNDGEALVIGYIGLMKSVESFEMLVWLARKVGKGVKVRFWGRFVFPLDEEMALSVVAAEENLEYMGAYRSPEDLKRVYASVDLVWDAYRDEGNSKWQRTTRFSESCFFKRPVFCDRMTPDGMLAAQHGIGIFVDFDDKEAFLRAFNRIDDAALSQLRLNLESLPDSLLYYEDEYDRLGSLMKLGNSESSRSAEV